MELLLNYLIGIHKFYLRKYGDDFDSAFMPALIFSLTIVCVLGSIDVSLLNSENILYLKKINKYVVLIPSIILTIIVYVYYNKNMPSKEIIKRSNQKPIGIVFCIFSIILFIIISILKPME